MERLSSPKQETVQYDVNEEPIVLSKHLLEILLKDQSPADVIGLYTFYYFIAKYQKTNQVWATTQFVANGMHWGLEKTRAVKARLKGYGLIEDVQTKNEDNTFDKRYIKINFIWTKTKVQEFPCDGKPVPRNSRTTENTSPKCLKENKEKCLKENKENIFVRDGKNGTTHFDKNEKYLPLANKLSEIIQTKKNIAHTPSQIKNWAKDIRKLEEQNKVEYARVEKALDWYEDNIGGQYIPVIESGLSLREKFDKLEEAVRRDGYRDSNNRHQTKNSIGSHSSGVRVTYKKADQTI